LWPPPPPPPPAPAGGACEVLPPGFVEFWARYPAKEGRAKALAEWMRLAPDDTTVVKILGGLALWLKSGRWAKGYIARPAKWLRERSWEDSPAPLLPCSPENFAGLQGAARAARALWPDDVTPTASPRAHPGEWAKREREALILRLIEEGVSNHQAQDRADAELARRAPAAWAPSGADDSGATP
jgi:hypothetical protein